MYRLYHQDGTRSTAALLVLEEGGLVYELHNVDISANAHRSAEFLAINPRGCIPTLVTEEGNTIAETGAIMMYLADGHHLTELAPSADDPARGTLYDWLFFHIGEVQEAGKRASYPKRYSTDPRDAPSIQASARETFYARWQIVDRQLAQHGPYHLGDRFSLVDLYLMTAVPWFDICSGTAGDEATGSRKPFGLEDLPAVKRCYELTAARPQCAPILKRHIAGVQALIANSLPE